MPRIQVSLPDDLVAEAKARGLDLDGLLEAAVREAVRLQVQEEERAAAFAALVAEAETVALPEETEARAKALFERVQRRRSKNKRAS